MTHHIRSPRFQSVRSPILRGSRRGWFRPFPRVGNFFRRAGARLRNLGRRIRFRGRAVASRTLGLVTGGLLAGGLTVPAIWTSYAQGAVQGRIDPGLAITRTLAVPRPVPLPPGPIRAGFIPR